MGWGGSWKPVHRARGVEGTGPSPHTTRASKANGEVPHRVELGEAGGTGRGRSSVSTTPTLLAQCLPLTQLCPVSPSMGAGQKGK